MTIYLCDFIHALIIRLHFIAEFVHRWVYSIGNLSSSANVVDMRIVSRCGLQKVGSHHRNFRVNALFGGKKDNEQSGDKVSQVCFLLPSMLHMNIHTESQIFFCIHIFYLFAFLSSFT
jgi:hypothetical protein